MSLMTITIIQRLEGNKKKNHCEGAGDQNSNKSHHLLYLWQQENTKPKPSIIIIIIAKKKKAHPDQVLYL
jgi:hypothetical protein